MNIRRRMRSLRRTPQPTGRHLVLTAQPWGPPYYAISEGPVGRELQWLVRADVPLLDGEEADTFAETVANVRRRRPDLPPYRTRLEASR